MLRSLPQFIREHREEILNEWDAYAGSLELGLDDAALRDDADRLLTFVADDMESTQTGQAQREKSQGRAPSLPFGHTSAAQDHGAHRHHEGFSFEQMVSEYRALRATVIRLWLARERSDAADTIDQLVRFNESIDQLVAESLSHFVREVDRSRQLFLGILGHDLRSPLSAVQSTAYALMRDPAVREPDRVRGERIFRSSERMRVMVSDLLDLTRTHLGTHLPIEPERCDIATIVRQVVDEIEASTSISIIVEATGDMTGLWDCARLSQMASNLIGNAVQHGSRDVPIRVSLADEGGAVALSVHNAGQPIPPSRQRTIFDPFVRHAEGPASSFGGLGLGLYICKQIVEAHGGAISLDSGAETGTTVRVILPKER